MRKLYNEALGLNISPFANHKDIAPAIIGAGIAAAASLGAAGLGSASQASANRKNEEMTKDTNKTNYQIWQEQLAAMREQWEQQQENFRHQREWSINDRIYENWYNSPQQQKLRYLQAGLNPALMMEGSNPVGSAQASTGTAPSPNAVPSAPNMVAPHVNPIDYSGFGLGMSSAVNTYLAAERQEADISAIRQRTNNETLETLSKISQRDWQNKEIKQIIDRMVYDLQFEKDNRDERSRFISYTNKAILADTAYKDSQTSLNKFQERMGIQANNRAWLELKQRISESVSRIALNASSEHKNYQDAAIGLQSEMKLIAENKYILDVYKNNKEQMDEILKKLKYETSTQGFKDLIRMLQGFIPFGGKGL